MHLNQITLCVLRERLRTTSRPAKQLEDSTQTVSQNRKKRFH